VSVGVALAGAAAVAASGWALQAAALPPPAHADRVAADASTWLHDYRLVVDVFHFDRRRVEGACLRGWFPGRKGAKAQGSMLSLGSGPILRLSGRRQVTRVAGPRERLPTRLLALAGCSGTLSRVLAGAAQSGRHLRVERSYTANQPAIALKLDRGGTERLTLYASPSTYRPLVVIAERKGRTVTARIYLDRITSRVLRRFHLPQEGRRKRGR
jgi:hypothetical protein